MKIFTPEKIFISVGIFLILCILSYLSITIFYNRELKYLNYLLLSISILTISYYILNLRFRVQDKNEVLEKEQRNQIQKYMETMSSYIIDNKLLDTKIHPENPDQKSVQDMAQTWTVAELQNATGKGKGEIIKFLIDKKLIVARIKGGDIGPQIYLNNANLDHIDLHETFGLRECLTVKSIRSANFSKSQYNLSNFNSNDFSHSNFNNAKFRECFFDTSKFIKASMKESKFRKCDLQDCDFNRADLRNAEFIDETKLMDARFNKTILKNTIFKDVNISNADFTKVKGLKKDQLIHCYYSGRKPKLPKGVICPPEKQIPREENIPIHLWEKS